MDKIAVGGNLPKGIIDIDEEPEINIKNLAKVFYNTSKTWQQLCFLNSFHSER